MEIWTYTYTVVSAILSGCGEFKSQSQETRLCETNENKFTLNSYYISPCSCLNFKASMRSKYLSSSKKPL